MLVSVLGGLGAAAAMEERDETEQIQGDVAVGYDDGADWNDVYAVSAPGDIPVSRGAVPGQLQLPEASTPHPSVPAEPVLDEPEPVAEYPDTPIEEPLGGTLTVALTFYVCTNAPPGQSYCGTMSSGQVVYEGAAACGYSMALGTRFRIVGEERTYICEDRGAGPHYWIDIFHYDYYAGRAWRDDWPQSVEIQVLP